MRFYDKTFQRINRKDIISFPKTASSFRIVSIPTFLRDELKAYIAILYEPAQDQRIFNISKPTLSKNIHTLSDKVGLTRITFHGRRHSHASLLVEMGFSPLLIAERLDHERVQTTMETYSHLYPNKQAEVARQLSGIL